MIIVQNQDQTLLVSYLERYVPDSNFCLIEIIDKSYTLQCDMKLFNLFEFILKQTSNLTRQVYLLWYYFFILENLAFNCTSIISLKGYK